MTDWSSRVTTYTYDDASRLTQTDRPNGTYRVQEYDEANQLRLIKEYKSDGSVLVFQEMRYDDDGRITYLFQHPKPADVTLAPDALLYDDDNCLSTWNSQSVGFDHDGNMTSGPLPSGTFGTHGYDARNRLTSAGGSGYTYNPDGLRVAITGTGAASFVVDPNAALSRTLIRTKGGTTTYYIYGLGLLYEETNGATKTYHCDQVGSTLALTDASQNVTDRWSYAPFGAIASRTGSTDTPFQFNGEFGVQTDPNGLLHMRARYYNPRLMRFCNADPIGSAGGLNHYAFVGNNPISFADPFGLCRDQPVTMLERFVVTARRTARDIADWAKETNARMNEMGRIESLAVAYGVNRVAEGVGGRIDAAVAEAGGGPLEAEAFKLSLGGVLGEAFIARAMLAESAGGNTTRWIWGQNKGVEKMLRQMQQRGWTPQQITEAIAKGESFPAQNLVNQGNAATRYVNPTTGRSVVIDDVTKEIIHVGGDGFKY